MNVHRVLLPLLLVAGCNATPLEYTSISDMKPGPGMLSGASGSFSMSKEVAPAAAQPAGAKPVPAISTEEYREFQEWREWRRAREEAGKK